MRQPRAFNAGGAVDADLAHLPFDSALRLTTSRAWLEIDLDAISANIETLRDHAGRGVEILLPVKADGYGHGAVEVAREAARCGVGWFGVASLEEALILRRGGIEGRILLLTPPSPPEIEFLVVAGIRTVVMDLSTARARREGVVHPVHVEVDTGMARTGVPWRDASSFVRDLAGMPNLRIEGLFCHLSSADEGDLSFSRTQLDRFRAFLDEVSDRLGTEPVVHVSNSAAALRMPEIGFPLIRPGLFVYGISPLAPGVGGSALRPRPAMSLRSRVICVRDVEAGDPVGYQRAFVAPRRAKIATVAVGYRDGVPYGLSNRGAALIRGARAPIVGNVCMDMLMVDVSSIDGVEAGERVTLIGDDGPERIGAAEIARIAGSIPYAVLTAPGKRVPRIYIRDGRPSRIMSRLGSRVTSEEESEHDG
jgi:alanine racemase